MQLALIAHMQETTMKQLNLIKKNHLVKKPKIKHSNLKKK